MSTAQTHYLKVGSSFEDTVQSQLFGKPCFKINGKPFVCFFEDAMVFKLTGDLHTEALSLDGSQLFDPSGKGRAMKEWIQVPFDYAGKWKEYADAALDYVSSLSK